MIDEILDKYFIENKRLGIEHRDKLFVTQASCNKLIAKGLTKLHGCCPRVAYYSCIGLSEKEVKKERSIARRLGDYTEMMLLNIFKNAGVLEDKAVKFIVEDINLSGKLDAIVKIDDERIGVEIKSLSSNKWINNHIFGSQWNKPTVKIEHLIQCMVYLYAYIGDINKFYLVYLRRDNGEYKEFLIELALVDNKLYPAIDGVVDYTLNCNDIIDNFKELKKCIDSDTVPKRGYMHLYSKEYAKLLYESKYMTKYMYEKYQESPFGDMECSNCGYKDICIKDGE